MAITITQRQQAWSTLTNASQDARDLADKAKRTITALQEDDRYAPEYKAQQTREIRDRLHQDLADLTAETQAARDLLHTAAGELSQPQGDANPQLLHETRQGRAWDRIRPQLESGRPHTEIITEAVNRKDAAALAALSVELPSWMETRRDRPGGMAEMGAGPLDLGGLRQRLDLATAQVHGDDKGPGTAARLRLHADAQHELVTATVEHARGTSPGLQTAIVVNMAQQNVESVEQQLADEAA